jgi:replicative DNA helicase
LLADGSRVPIRDLVGQTPEVLSMNEQGRLIKATSDKVWRVGPKPVFEVRLASGRRLRGTANHRLYGADGWRTIGELRAGDRLGTARQVPEPSTALVWPEPEIILLAHLMGDGSYLKGQPLRYTTASDANSRIVSDSAIQHFGVQVNRHEGKGAWHQLVFSGNGNRWHPAGMNLWLRNLGIFGQRSHEKRVPSALFQLANEQIALFLRHLWATDGTISPRKHGQRGSHGVHLSTNSQGLADDVMALLLRLGIRGRIQAVKSEQYRTTYMVWIRGAEQQRLFLGEVGAFGPRENQAKLLSALITHTVPQH